MSHGMRKRPDKVEVSEDIERLATIAVQAAFEVHSELGPGLLEGAYEACFCRELEMRGLTYQVQLPVPLEYKGRFVEVGFRADVIMERRLLIELKAVEAILPIHRAQAITYLKLLKLPLGLLINFNEVLIKNGIRRILNVPKV